jgi:hypothetical protein
VTTIPVAAGMQAPGAWLCDCTTLVLRPNGGLNEPVKPAAVQAALASATVAPTRSGTTKQSATGVGDGVGAVDGVGVGVGSGVGSGDGVGFGPIEGLGVDPGGGATGVGGAVGAEVGNGVPGSGCAVRVAPCPPAA